MQNFPRIKYQSQGHDLDRIENNIEQTKHETKEANQQLVKAHRYTASRATMLGAVIGAALLGPAGLLIGAKAALGLGVGGAILGGGVGKKISSSSQARIENMANDTSKATEKRKDWSQEVWVSSPELVSFFNPWSLVHNSPHFFYFWSCA